MASRTRRPRGRGAELRRELLDAALEILDDAGSPDAITVRGVASAVGVAPNAVYLHFADRLDLLGSLAVELFQLGTIRITEAAAGASTAREMFIRGHVVYCSIASETPGRYRLMFGPSLSGFDGPSSSDLTREALAYYDTLTAVVQAMMAEGSLPRGPVDEMAATIWAMEHGWCELHMNGMSDFLTDAETAARTLLDLGACEKG